MFPLTEDGYFCSDDESHYIETWKYMETLVDSGVVRSIGLSNFNKKQIVEVVQAARIPVSTLQNECHPYLQQKDLIDLCRFYKIAFQAFSPLGSGETHLNQTGPSPTGTIPLTDKLLLALAAKYGKDVGQIMLKWAVQRGITLVSKSVTPARIEGNIKIFDWELSQEDFDSISTLNCGCVPPPPHTHTHTHTTHHTPPHTIISISTAPPFTLSAL
jgi:diketogulonate reductase-like aldo/keto reductase